MKRLIPLMIVVLVGGATSAQAFYIGGSFLSTDARFREAVDRFDTDDTSYKLYAGGRLSKFVNLEATYRDLGTHADTAGADRLTLELEAYDLALRGVIPLGRRISASGRVGWANVSRKGQLDLSGIIRSIDDDSWELTYGVGIDYQLLSRFGLRAEWEKYDADESLSSFSAGAFFRF